MLLLVLNLGEIVGSTYNPPPMTHPYHDHVTLLPVCMYVCMCCLQKLVIAWWDGMVLSIQISTFTLMIMRVMIQNKCETLFRDLARRCVFATHASNATIKWNEKVWFIASRSRSSIIYIYYIIYDVHFTTSAFNLDLYWSLKSTSS